MAFRIPKNTANAAERRIPFVLVDATDFSTPEDITVTGVKVDLSFGGGTDAPSTNDIVKVDGAKGMYCLELTQSEADNALGPVHGYLKPTGCAASYLEAEIVSDVPTTLAAVKAKTDNLPADPADASDIASAFGTVNSTLATIDGRLDTEIAAILAAVDTEVGAIKTITDALLAGGATAQAIAQEVLLAFAMGRGNKVEIVGTDLVLKGTDGSTVLSTQPFTRLASAANPMATVG